MPVSKSQDIRNVIFLGHGGSGKTSMADAILFSAKVSNRLGSVTDGTSLLDFSDIEKERKHSVDPAMAFVEHEGKLINIIDAPGYPDFIGGAIGAMNGADAAVVFISAAAGIEVNTRRLFKAAQDAGIPTAIMVSKIDAENADLPRLMDQIAETFGKACKAVTAPSDNHKHVEDILDKDEGETDIGHVHDLHTALIDSIVETDEKLMEAYLAGEKVSLEQLIPIISKAMLAGNLIPVFFSSTKDNIGIKDFLDFVAKDFPSPADENLRPVREGEKPDSPEAGIVCDPSKHFVAQAVKITADPFVGKLAWVRIIQGTATPETTFVLRDAKKGGKIGHMFKVQGKDTIEVKQALAGDMIALAKVEGIHCGDVLHTDAKGLYREILKVPTPMYSLAVTPKTRGDEQKISEALTKLGEEDPTFVTSRDHQTGETVISGIGDLHLRIMLTKMKKRYDLEVDTKPPKIPYRETITAKASGHYRHKKQTGGAGQFGEVYLRVEPMPRGGGYEYVDELFGESIPRQYLPAIEKGVHDILHSGAIAGFPMQDLRVAITDGKHHPVDSKDIAFRTAGKYAFLDAIEKAKPAILEPIVNMEITVPANYMGDIAGDLSGRRGRIIGQDMLAGNMCVIKAQAPLAEVMQYNSQLRSATAGQGSYSMEFSHYEPVPGNVQAQIVASAVKRKDEDREK